jgi:hypothetical protein
MTREDERSPPSEYECWEGATASDIEGHRCRTTCPLVYHSETSPVRSARPFTDWLLSVQLACPECALPFIGYTHPRCGE